MRILLPLRCTAALVLATFEEMLLSIAGGQIGCRPNRARTMESPGPPRRYLSIYLVIPIDMGCFMYMVSILTHLFIMVNL